jgi:hypothetical protein
MIIARAFGPTAPRHQEITSRAKANHIKVIVSMSAGQRVLDQRLSRRPKRTQLAEAARELDLQKITTGSR